MFGKVFATMDPAGGHWSPIREPVAAGVAYSQSRCVIDFS